MYKAKYKKNNIYNYDTSRSAYYVTVELCPEFIRNRNHFIVPDLSLTKFSFKTVTFATNLRQILTRINLDAKKIL
jgi:hypothetical protein